ncbi:lysophosphatidylcholine acyltransferase 1 isoform X3 [Phocoena sinus]|uniref:lysophosphatidylcholine acyltransferase 1 isoform X3 n=1 Tax=Phocoena sinus TaxID=42100 RepID=UPI0013C4BFB1|nr:lysophosphatidylcholine acyltransferase 1 isoform X3 [Phocoena sinus]
MHLPTASNVLTTEPPAAFQRSRHRALVVRARGSRDRDCVSLLSSEACSSRVGLGWGLHGHAQSGTPAVLGPESPPGSVPWASRPSRNWEKPPHLLSSLCRVDRVALTSKTHPPPALIKYIRPVFVSRMDQDSRRKTVEVIKRRAQSSGKWPQIMIFPEGTCTNRTCLITFKPGAFIPGVPVQPVVLRYPNKLDTITWTWQGPGALKILWLTLCQFHNQVEIEFLPVYTPSEEEKQDPALYASNVRHVMAEALGVSVTDYTFEDCQLALAEGQLRLPADTCLLEFARLVRGLGLKPEKLERDLDRHADSARMKQGGSLTLPKFAAQLEVPESQALEDLFALFDERGGGEMDMREYVVALSVVCRPSQTLDTIRLAFKMYGSLEDGSIDEHALSSILKTALGVAELTVTDLFRAIDQEEKGRITFADFERFAEAYPDFAEEYLYPEQTHSQSCAQTPPAPTPNGFCADFSPENSAAGTEPVRKKLD